MSNREPAELRLCSFPPINNAIKVNQHLKCLVASLKSLVQTGEPRPYLVLKNFAQDIDILIPAILTAINKTFRRILVSSRAAMPTARTVSLQDRYEIELALYFPGIYRNIHTIEDVWIQTLHKLNAWNVNTAGQLALIANLVR